VIARWWFTAALAALACLAQEPAAPFVEWLSEVQRLEAQHRAGRGDMLEEARALSSAVSRWLLQNPGMRTPPSRTPPDELHDLREWIEQLIRLNPSGPFHLGRIEVRVTAEAPAVPGAYVVSGGEIAAHNLATLTSALSLAPGITITRVGARNEGVVYLRGFDMRQTPVYFDGMPVSVPFDGYADLDRFLTHDVAEVHIARGFSSTLYGPNTLGGAINLVSRQPVEKVHGDVETGYESGRAFHGLASLGARMRKFYIQSSGGWLERDFFPLPGAFQSSALQPGRRRSNSDRRDGRGHFKLGITPRAGDEYAFGYLKQNARKGQPPYAGGDASVRIRYWRWPEWGKDSFYHIANKTLGPAAHLRLRLYYDTFHNRLDSFDDARYSTQTRSTSFISLHDDHSWGGRLEFATSAPARHLLKTSLALKDDTHREHNLGEPQRRFRARTLSMGLEDSIRLGSQTQALLGFSADRMDVLQAQNFQQGVVSPFPTGGLWALNPQAGLVHTLSEADRLRLTFARKTRLPTLKDRYSYRIGRSLPNPDLEAEQARHLEAGYSRSVGAGTLLDAAVFYAAISGLLQEFAVGPQLFQYRNLGRVTHAGFELAARTGRLRPATLHAHYTYLHRKNVSLPSIPLIQTPRHTVAGQGLVSLRGGVRLAGDIRLEAGRWDLSESGRYLKLGGFAVVSANATFPLGRRLELQAGARNLTDRHYYLDEGFPEEGRSLYLNLRYRF